MDDNDLGLIQLCLRSIEAQLGWGESASWSTQDFESLSKKILTTTGVNLSVATLKRIWGKIKYESRPTVTTLDALARYAGHENWRAFRHTAETPDLVSVPPDYANFRRRNFLIGAGGLVAATGVLIFLTMGKQKSPVADPMKFEFSSKTVVDEGVPNSVIFDYDATAALPTDSVFIQQSWDTRLSRQVLRDNHQHTSIYYYPGYFEAKLRINQQVMKEHKLLIRTAGWLPLIQQPTVPVYFTESDARHHGVLGLPLEKITGSHIDLQPKVPWTALCNIREFAGVTSGDFIFETDVRNEYREGSAACQFTVVRLQFEGPAIEIPLSVPGCVSELSFMNADGKKRDLSAFGCDLSKWTKVRCDIKGDLGEIFINDKSAIKFKLMGPAANFVGITYRFQGAGSVDGLKISGHDGHLYYEEQF